MGLIHIEEEGLYEIQNLLTVALVTHVNSCDGLYNYDKEQMDRIVSGLESLIKIVIDFAGNLVDEAYKKRGCPDTSSKGSYKAW